METATGVVLISDFMPLRGENSDLVRIATCLSGRVDVHMELILRFDYGRTLPWVSRLENGDLRAIAGPHMVVLHAETGLEGRNNSTISDFCLNAGECRSFVLTYGASHLSLREPVDARAALAATVAFWQEWARDCTVQGEWRDVVVRSLITLKALTYRPTGGIVAALTTSLPEKIGGERNWDYRHCWLRDATFTLLALMSSGYYKEAKDWRSWLIRAAAGSPSQVQIMYGLAGERDLPERILPWLPGYENSAPVRVGNAAVQQLQLDIYNEVADVLHQARCGGLEPSRDAWALECALTNHLEEIWQTRDEGIWEFRGLSRRQNEQKALGARC